MMMNRTKNNLQRQMYVILTAPQVYTSSRVSNHFHDIEDLVQTCIFSSDRVLDTLLNGNYFTLLIDAEARPYSGSMLFWCA